MIIPRLCIAASSGGGGKTLLTLGLGRIWSEQGLAIKPFKKGPDYIDAAWLTAACGSPATNLDPFFLSDEELKRLFIGSIAGYELALLEGNRGLFDGADAEGSYSTANLARLLKCPVLLCVDCSKTTRTAAAIIYGLTHFEKNLDFMGVVLNRVGSPRHEQALVKSLNGNIDLPILGALPRMKDNPIPEQHMGLVPAVQGRELTGILDKLAKWVRAGCDTSKILALARSAAPLPLTQPKETAPPTLSSKPPVIGVVSDKAFWFYYPENLQALKDAGCALQRFSLLDGTADPSQYDAIYLGGGFPEDYLPELSQSCAMHDLKDLALQGMPIYAECGGLMVLCQEIIMRGERWPMADLFKAIVQWFDRPQGLGYAAGTIEGNNPYYPVGEYIKGHEFHYSRCFWEKPPPKLVLRLDRGKGVWQDASGTAWDGLVIRNTWASYTHIFAPALPHWAASFSHLAAKGQR